MPNTRENARLAASRNLRAGGGAGNYVAQIDTVDAESWHALLDQFDDANFYQTWSHGAAKWGAANLSHLVLLCAGEPVAISQLSIVHAPLLGARMAHQRFGPIWQRRNRRPEPEHYRAMLLALAREYCLNRGLMLRLKPWEHAQEQQDLMFLRSKSGFEKQGPQTGYNSFVLDLSIGIESIHSGLSRSWRRDLRHASKAAFTTRCTRDLADLQTFMGIYAQMQADRPFVEYTDIDLLIPMVASLPERHRPYVMLCFDGDEAVAGIVFSLLGNRAFALHGASTHQGLQRGASYVVNWAVLQWLVQDGRCRWYDLVGGVDNAGIRHFKAGLAKGCGQEMHMPDFDIGGSLLTRQIVRIGERIWRPPRQRRTPYVHRITREHTPKSRIRSD